MNFVAYLFVSHLLHKYNSILNAEEGALSFVTDNIVFQEITNGAKRITKITSNGFEEGVYLNRFIADLPTFSVKIMKLKNSISVGVAVDSSHFTLPLYETSWCCDSTGYICDHSALGNETGIRASTNSIVSVTVDLNDKTISYKIDGKSVETPQSVKLVDSEFKRLRPTVQMYYEGDSVEIYQ